MFQQNQAETNSQREQNQKNCAYLFDNVRFPLVS